MSVNVKFVSRKINKIRWRPKSSSLFITGSYDDDENNLTIWKFPNPALRETEKEECFEENDPVAVCMEDFPGCVTDLKIISDELFFASSSLGSLFVYKYSDENLLNVYAWKNVHYFKRDIASITAIAAKGQEVASVGEDGRLCVFNFNHMQKLRDIECSDQCSFTAVNYLRHQEIVVSNSLGYLRIYDLRSPSNISSCMLIHSRNQSGISSMNIHSTQSHVLATGNEDGSMHLWDMRQDKQPVSVLEGHSASISELMFHPSNPDFMFTCSLDGSLLQWDSSALRNNYIPHHQISTVSETLNQSTVARNPWLASETNKNRLEITSLFSESSISVNTLDFSGSTLLWATSNEAICMCNDIDV